MRNLKNDSDLKQILKLLFDEPETVCSSPTFYGTASKSQDDVNANDAFLTINPVNGFRRVADVTAFRTFLVEIDPSDWDQLSEYEKSRVLEWQREYVEQSGMPYSACIFSGNKSLHFLITIDEAMRDYEEYKFLFRWLANVLSKVDVQAGNAIVGVRIPGHRREDTGKLQRLEVIRGRVSKSDFIAFLEKHPEAKPIEKSIVERKLSNYQYTNVIAKPGEYGRLSSRTLFFLDCGAPKGEWHHEFRLAVKDLKAQNYSIEEAEHLLSQIDGYLDEKSLKQLRYGYDDFTFEMSFRPFQNELNSNSGGEQ